MTCYTCKRIEMIKNNKFPFFVEELETGYVVLGDHQYFRGYTLFIFKDHVTSINDIDKDIQLKFMQDLLLVQEAVYKTFKCNGVDIELLSNSEHLTWHIFPREDGDVPNNSPVWSLHKSILYNTYNMLNSNSAKEMVSDLRETLNNLKKTR
ncbi:MAG: HIT family protein [Erysipelotrichaceae bacterium]|nr:HIT family protein [Erysipelotrichaceae bacterium]